jgi:type IV pilus assembly protein PilO
MTVSGDFIPDEDQGFEEESQFPTVFGIQLTPVVLGVIAALLLVGGAIFAFLNLVQPRLQTQADLKRQIQEREAQLSDTAELQRLIEETRAEREAAEQLQADVLELFADEESLETLLFDVNARVKSANAGIEDEERQAVLSRFEINESESGVINDGSLGESVNGRLERQVYNVEMKGSFAQIQSILRSMERLQPLLTMHDFNTSLEEANQTWVINQDGSFVEGESFTRLVTSFRLDALLPSDAPPPPPPGEEGEEGAEGQEPAEGAEAPST